MSNPISENMKVGTIGELLVQLRLLEYGVQAAAPLKDTGNDLVALRGRIIKTIQVKTCEEHRMPTNRIYDLVAFVDLAYDDRLFLDHSVIYIVLDGQPVASKRVLSQELVDEIWPQP